MTIIKFFFYLFCLISIIKLFLFQPISFIYASQSPSHLTKATLEGESLSNCLVLKLLAGTKARQYEKVRKDYLLNDIQ